MKCLMIDGTYMVRCTDELNFSIYKPVKNRKTGEVGFPSPDDRAHSAWRYASRIGEALRLIAEDMERDEFRNGHDETITDLNRVVGIVDGIRNRVRKIETVS